MLCHSIALLLSRDNQIMTYMHADIRCADNGGILILDRHCVLCFTSVDLVIQTLCMLFPEHFSISLK